MATLPKGLPASESCFVFIAIYTEGIFLWCVWQPWQMQARFQDVLAIIRHRLEDLGISVSPPKTASMVYRSWGRLSPTKAPLCLNGDRIQRVLTHTYLGLTIDYRLSWHPAVGETLALFRRLFFCTSHTISVLMGLDAKFYAVDLRSTDAVSSSVCASLVIALTTTMASTWNVSSRSAPCLQSSTVLRKKHRSIRRCRSIALAIFVWSDSDQRYSAFS